MNNFDLKEKINTDYISSSNFGGVLSSDELPDEIKSPVFYIVNTDPSYMPGKHWIVIFVGEEVEYFDPLGEAPNSLMEHYLWRINPNGYLRNNKRVQGSRSNNCGQFCLYYSYYRVRNYTMQCILNSLTLDYAYNDYIVDQFVDNYL
jgi:hypothetical protein